jgi:hypothetical protein
MTMAYVFWHTHSKEIPQEAYENNLLAFYVALALPSVGIILPCARDSLNEAWQT